MNSNIEKRVQTYLIAQAKGGCSPSYVKSIARPLGEFVGFVEFKKIARVAKLTDATLVAYRKYAERTPAGNKRALSTMRMELRRVASFLRAQPDCRADLSALCVTHTKAEKRERASKLDVKAEAAAARKGKRNVFAKALASQGVVTR